MRFGPAIGGFGLGVTEGLDSYAKRELQRAQELAKLYDTQRAKEQAPLQDALMRAQTQHLLQRPQWMQQQDQEGQAIRALLQFAQGSGQATPMPQQAQAQPISPPGSVGTGLQPPPMLPPTMPQGSLPAPIQGAGAVPQSPASQVPGAQTGPLPPPIQGAGAVPQQPQRGSFVYPPDVLEQGRMIAAQYGPRTAKMLMDAEMERRNRDNQLAIHQAQLDLSRRRAEEMERRTDVMHEDREAARAQRADIEGKKLEFREKQFNFKRDITDKLENNKAYRVQLNNIRRGPNAIGKSEKELKDEEQELKDKYETSYAWKSMSEEDRAKTKAAMKDTFNSAGSTKEEHWFGYGTPTYTPNEVYKEFHIAGRTFLFHGNANNPMISVVE